MLKKYLKKPTSLHASLLAGLALVLVGVLLYGITLFNTWKGERSVSALAVSQALKSNKVTNDGTPTISGIPVHITIPSVAIDLRVIPGSYYPASDSWTLSLNDAQWGTMTAPANNKSGDTFIYAHYRKAVFLTLPKIAAGATATVTTENGHVFIYTFRDSVVTSPEDTSLFNYRGKPILVLQTCTGLWYQNRQLFTFDLSKAS